MVHAAARRGRRRRGGSSEVRLGRHDDWADYEWWQLQDRKVLKRINALLHDIARNGNEGIGKPEPPKHGFQGYWSRRITEEHRLVHRVAGGEIRIADCRYHCGS